jgi:hypothetical protein
LYNNSLPCLKTENPLALFYMLTKPSSRLLVRQKGIR